MRSISKVIFRKRDSNVRSSRSDQYPRGPVCICTVISHLPAYDAAYVMKNDNLVTALSVQIQVSLVLTNKVEKPSLEPIA